MTQKKSPIRVVFVAAEVAPFAKVGGLADVIGSLPKALSDIGCAPSVIAPRYESIRLGDIGTEQVATISVPFGNESYQAAVYQSHLFQSVVPLYLIDQPLWLSSGDIYQNKKTTADPHFILKRFLFFCRAAHVAIGKLKLRPQIVHTHDWMSGPMSLLNDRKGQRQSNPRHVLTIHNISNDGYADADLMALVGLTPSLFSPLTQSRDNSRFYNTFAQSLLSVDAINTVSPTYAREILKPAFGEGLVAVLKKRSKSLHGILNGIDTEYFNPATDKFIAKPFTQDSLGFKRKNKTDLQNSLRLQADPEAFLCGVVTRLSEQKGIELIIEMIERTAKDKIRVAILGEGNQEYEQKLRKLMTRYPNRVAFSAKYDSHLARKIYAGADAFLMPSRYEPCGLAQMIALRYGTIPIVHDTGGLHDTVVDWHKRDGQGFLFKKFTSVEFLRSVEAARKEFANPAGWQKLQLNAMSADHSWKRSAEEYLRLYQSIL